MKRTAVRVWALLLAAMLLCTPVFAGEEAAKAPAEEPEIVDPYQLYPYEQLTEDLAALAARYPTLVSVSSIGESVQGRSIPLLTLGRGDRAILLCAAMHGREYETTNYLMYVAEQYCRAYTSDDAFWGLSYRTLLDGVRFLIVPVLNPDGVLIAQQGTDYALTDPALAAMPITDGWPGNYYCWKANANGVDLNRNWPYCFNNTFKSKAPSSADHAGPEPLSEPETRAMGQLLECTDFYAFCSFHSAGNCVYWIDDTNPQPLRDRLYPIASRIADSCGYMMIMGEDLSRGGGYMINHARAVYEKPCLTVEIGPYVGRYPYPDYARLRPIIEKAYPVPLLLADEVLKMPKAEKPVTVTLDGAALHFPDAQCVIENGWVLTPLRPVCEAAGLSVGWDDGTVTVTDGERVVRLVIGEPLADIGGTPLPLECAPVLRDGRTLIPIRAVMEAFGLTVDWDEATRTVELRSAPARETDAPPDHAA